MIRNLYLFYGLIFIPLILMALVSRDEVISPLFFSAYLAFYAFVYHPLICGARLVAKGIIEAKDFWKILVPFRTAKYLKELFLAK